MRLKIEATRSFQIEGAGESYCATVYSRHDAELIKKLAEKIPGLKCLKQHATGKQPKGFYLYLTRGRETYPVLETYDRRLDKAARKVQHLLKGET